MSHPLAWQELPSMSGTPSPRSSHFSIEEHSIDALRPLKVICVGGGISGILAGIRIPQKIKNVEFVLYDKNEDLGGTWFENRYPGVACDMPSHTYQLSFEPNTQWSAYYAPGKEIHDYLLRLVEKYKIRRHARLCHQLMRAQWNEERSKWMFRFLDLSTGLEVEDESDIFISAVGALNALRWPDIPGFDDFEGHKAHSARWTEFDHIGKRVAVVGNGSSSVQIVPALAKRVQHLDCYIRGSIWIAAMFENEDEKSALHQNLEHDPLEPGGHSKPFTIEELRRFAEDPEYYKAYRYQLESEINAVHALALRDSDMQVEARRQYEVALDLKLAAKPHLAKFIDRSIPIACRRQSPGVGYLAALSRANVHLVQTQIARMTKTGIVDGEGNHREYDSIICATGFDSSMVPQFEVVGRNGRTLQDKWALHSNAYLSVAVDEFPNMFLQFGPNAGVGTGSLLIILERAMEYAIKCIQKMQKERIRSMEVKAEAAQDWSDYVDAYFPRTVYAAKCRSWYKNGREEGRITGLWPGSCLHAVRTLEQPRFEDFNYVHLSSQQNRLAWLGDGWTDDEKLADGDKAFYLRELDIPPVPL